MEGKNTENKEKQSGNDTDKWIISREGQHDC